MIFGCTIYVGSSNVTRPNVNVAEAHVFNLKTFLEPSEHMTSHDAALVSMRRCYIASSLVRRHYVVLCPLEKHYNLRKSQRLHLKHIANISAFLCLYMYLP